MGTLSTHFSTSEFERDWDLVPAESLLCFADFCNKVLEPLRINFGEPWFITSGYRSADSNKRIGGVPDSQHVATKDHCACDGYFESYRKNGRPVFDWLRLESVLPFDQCILEWGKYGSIIHLSYSTTPRRQALEGQTFNQSGYTSWPVSA